MAVTSRCLLAAVLVFTLCAGTSCERRNSGKKPPPQNPAIEALTSEGDAAYQQGRHDVALAAYQKAFALRDKAGDPKSWCVTATSVARTYMQLHAHQLAEPLLTEVLRLRQEHCGPLAPETAETHELLERYHKAMAFRGYAEQSMRQELATLEATKGKDHPEVAARLVRAAPYLQNTNRLAEAEVFLRRALAIFEALGREGRPEVAKTLHILAQLLQAANRPAEAEPLLRRALAIDEGYFGKLDPHVARDLANLAQFLQAENRLAEAEPLLRRIVAMADAYPNKDNPELAIQLNNLAQLLKATNRRAEAEPYLRRALTIYVAYTVTVNHKHENLQTATNDYRSLLVEMGETEEQAREKVRKILTPEGVISKALDKAREEVLQP